MNHLTVLCVFPALLLVLTVAAQGAVEIDKARYQAAYERLTQEFSLERVAEKKIEVGFDDVSGMATPLSVRVPIQALHHPDLVFVQPDLSISLGTSDDALGVGFALGNPPVFPNILRVERSLEKGYLPIVRSSHKTGNVKLTQTAFSILPSDKAVVTGEEAQYVIVRIAVKNEGKSEAALPLWLLIGKMNGSQRALYEPFLAPLSRWQTEGLHIEHRDSSLLVNGRLLLSYRCSPGVPVALEARVEGVAGGEKPYVTNCLRFDLRLRAGQTENVDFVLSGSSRLLPADDRAAMDKVEFDMALKKAVAHYEGALRPAMKLVTPERRINNIYKAVILSNLGMLVKTPGKAWHMPLQTPVLGVWSWEFAHMAEPMCSVGYGSELEMSLRYFTDRQNGIGPDSANASLSGDVKSTKGTFTGTVCLWMNETGSILWAMASKYMYLRDADWLKANKGSILAAWDWIQRERSATKVLDEAGGRVPHYGLLPAGVADDVTGKVYSVTLTDNFTWYGMSQMAEAFAEAGLPEAERLKREAEEYRQCILDAVHRIEVRDPETGLRVIPNAVGGKLGDHYWPANGPVQLFDTGILAPGDRYFEHMIGYTERKHGILMGLAEHIEGGAEWYPNQTERAYFKCYLARGEVEKALLVLYSDLVYGMSNDTLQTCERFHFDDPNFAPLQPNASGNGRIMGMLRRMVIDEQDAGSGVLWLLRGCPRRWFAKGKSIVVEKAPTLFGEITVRTESDGNVITVDIECPKREPPSEIRLVVRHPERLATTQATANGQIVPVDGETVILRRPRGHLSVVCNY